MKAKNIHSSLIWTALFFIVSLAKTVWLTPVMLMHWGVDLFALWAILLSGRAFIFFISDAFIRYIQNEYNLLFHTQKDKAQYSLSVGFRFLLVLVSLTLMFVISILIFLKPQFTKLFTIELPFYSSFIKASIFYFTAYALYSLQKIVAATNEARGFIHQNLIFEVVLLVFETLLLGCYAIPYLSWAEAIIIQSIVIGSFSLLYLIRNLKRYPLVKGNFKLQLTDGIQHFKTASTLYFANFFEKLQGDFIVLLLSFFQYSKPMIASFSTVRTLINTPILAHNQFLLTLSPKAQKYIGLRDNVGLDQLCHQIRSYAAWIFGLGIIALLPFYESIFTWWTKGRLAFDAAFFYLMLSMAVVHLYGLSFLFLFKAWNRNKSFLLIMSLKSILLLMGLLMLPISLFYLGLILFILEMLFSILVLPSLLKQELQKVNMNFSVKKSLLAYIPYMIIQVILYLYCFYNF